MTDGTEMESVKMARGERVDDLLFPRDRLYCRNVGMERQNEKKSECGRRAEKNATAASYPCNTSHRPCLH